MKVIASELNNKLGYLKSGVPMHPTFRQSECVIFQSGKAYTFSGDCFAVVDCDLGFEGAVQYESFVGVLGKYGDNEVEIDLKSPEVLVIKRGRSQTKLPFNQNIVLSIQAVAHPDQNGWKALPEEFIEAVKACESVVVGRNDDVLSSFNVTPTAVEAASTWQLIRYNCTLDIPQRFLVRAGDLKTIIRSGIKEYQVVDRWLFFRSDVVTFALPVYWDDFIDDMDTLLLPAANSVTFPTELADELPFINAVLGRGDLVRVELSNGKCILTADSSRGTHTAEADMVSPIDLSFALSPVVLGRVLQEFPECTISQNGIKVNNDKFSTAISVE